MSTHYSVATGFVIGRRQLGEADRILRLFTREQGKIDVVARGIRRSGAKLMSRTEPFYEVEWRLVQGRAMPVVTGAEVMQAAPEIRDLEWLWLGHGLLELTEHSFHTDERSDIWYDFLRSAFASLDATATGIIWLLGLVKSLDQLGLSPDLPRQTEAIRIRIADGQVGESTGERLSGRTIKLWRILQEFELERVLKVRGIASEQAELVSFLERFWNYHTGVELKARQLV